MKGRSSKIIVGTTPDMFCQQHSWTLLGAVLGIGCGIGSAVSSSSSFLSASSLLALAEEWIRQVFVHLYTIGVLVYLALRLYYTDRSTTAVVVPKATAAEPLIAATKTTAATEPTTAANEGQQGEPKQPQKPKPIDMKGSYQVVENNNFGELLKAQGLPSFLARAAAKARPTHTFVHEKQEQLLVQIKGIIDSQTMYNVGSSIPTETKIRGRVFRDTMSYLYENNVGSSKSNGGGETAEHNTAGGTPATTDDPLATAEAPKPKGTCVGVRTVKVAVGEGYRVDIERRIVRAGTTWEPNAEANPDGHHTYDLHVTKDIDRLLMTNKIVYDENDERNTDKVAVIASQLFHRID
mmetsp:Transcript_116736/g.238810  ORF Transcript_116736/g.238810 Transcript_116736/m.238810 type:complete len:351 (+) Transcript_116736:399-1451(+)|eukprot:CAMPEP_0201215000 /NCGR_PEP_ID=MMETSP0851-20130426/188716_1 /ASSEMBLY_ACC=CAM_ASM_000631 /TAXON_ID=183588 /ORGANISM="Pseudo-nitzschia fraudulenta, Strain WWA7" /LENGTH=350 /DNA_ID=CAMNT_0047504401 /DNA_START=262 /DNA_END=1314 /DNA_ORIENTATION=+